MANRNRPQPGQYRPPDLRELAYRRSIDPADLPTQADSVLEAWPIETAEVELIADTTEANLPPIPSLGPPPGRRATPRLAPPRDPPDRRRTSRWVGNLVMVAIGFGLLGGIGFALSAVWVVQPAETERWFERASEWIGASEIVEEVDAPGLDVMDDVVAVETVPRLEEALLGDEVAFDDRADDVVDAQGIEDEDDGSAPPAASEIAPPEPEVAPPEPAVAAAPARRPRPRRARPQPRVVATPKPSVKPYEERPGPVEEEPPPTADDGLILER